MSDVLLAGAAAFFLWVLASQLHTPVIRPVQRWLRTGWRRSLVSCPFCFGFWAAVILVAALQWGRLDPIDTPVSILAATAVCGFLGSFTAGIEDEEDIA